MQAKKKKTKSSKKKAQPKNNIVANIILLFSVLIILFLLVEITLRVGFPQLTTARAERISPQIYAESDYSPYKFIPHSEGRIISSYGNEFDVPVKINSAGLRDYEISKEELANKKVVAAIGDSFTYGFGVHLDDTYHKQLGEKLGEEYRVINLGFADGAFGTDSQYLYLKKKGLKLNPDIVVLGYSTTNDISDYEKVIWEEVDENGLPTSIHSTKHTIDENSRLRRPYNADKEFSLYGVVDNFMKRYSHSYVFAKRAVIGMFYIAPDPIHTKSKYEEDIEAFEVSKNMLLEINNLLKENNVEFIVILIPALTQIDESRWQVYEQSFGDDAERGNPQKEIMKFCNENNLNCVDPLESFIGKPDHYFPIDGHWNEKGHALAAEQLYEYMEEIEVI